MHSAGRALVRLPVPRPAWQLADTARCLCTARVALAAATPVPPINGGAGSARAAGSVAASAGVAARPAAAAASTPYLAAAGGSVRARNAAAASRAGSAPSLAHFVLRAQVLSLYRRVLRTARRCPTPQIREETIAHARAEIAAMRGASELSHIKALLQEGRRKLESLETMLNLTH